MVSARQLKKKQVELYFAELGAIRSSKNRLTSQRRVCIKAIGRLTRCMVLVVSGGLLEKFTLAIGQLT